MFGLGHGGDGCGSLLMLLLLLQCCNKGNDCCECDCHDDCLGGDMGNNNCCNSGGFGGDCLMWILLLKCLCR
ncbi:MAG: hypothetical protein FWD16_08270 [Clostridia bacterium]|nr:hypothetical protein [Clostridia bacterium]